MNIEKIVRSVTKLAVRCLDPDTVIRFGSVAQGRARADSDIDLLVVSRFREPKGLRAAELRGLLDNCPLQVDMKLYTVDELAAELENPHSLASTALAQGILLYRRPGGMDLPWITRKMRNRTTVQVPCGTAAGVEGR